MRSLAGKRYESQLAKWQGRLAELVRHKSFARRSPVLVFEGSDAAGKGGAIRRIARRSTRAATSVMPDRRAHRRGARAALSLALLAAPAAPGPVTIFDRSWYGRVLVERVEGFCAEAEWRRAYAEINDFEEQLVERGAIVVKFWLADHQGGAAAPLQGAREDALQAVQDHRRGLAQPREVGRLREAPRPT